MKIARVKRFKYNYRVKTTISKKESSFETHKEENERWSSYKERKGNALALGAEEGRSKHRNATGSSQHALIRRYPNGGTQLE